MRPFIIYLALLVVLIAGPIVSEAQTESTLKTISPCLQVTTAIIVKLDTGRIALPDIESGNVLENVASKLLVDLKQQVQWLSDTADGKPVYLMFDISFSNAQPLTRVFFESSSEQARQQLTETLIRFNGKTPVPFGDLLFTSLDPGPSSVAPTSISSKTLPVSTDRLAMGLKATESFPVQIVIVPPEYLWRTYEELMTELPSQFGGGPVTRLTQGFRWAAIWLDPQTMNMMVTIQSASPDAAQQFALHLPELIKGIPSLMPEPHSKKLNVVAAELANVLKSEVVDDQIHLSIDNLPDVEQSAARLSKLARLLLVPFLKQDIHNNLRQLALAVHNYESAYGSFPPAAKFRSEDGRSGLSWRVHILPFIEQGELYNQFKLDEPWDSPHNIKLVDRMPDLFKTDSFQLGQPDSEIAQGHTTLVAPTGEGTIFGGKEVVEMRHLSDGTSNTIMFVEVKPERAVPWTAPIDYEFDPKNPAAGLNIGDDGKFFAALGDGSVQTIRGDLPAESLMNLFQMNDGNVVRLD